MPLLMEGLGGSIWPPTLAHTSEKQALGTPACQGVPAWDQEPALCSIWGNWH